MIFIFAGHGGADVGAIGVDRRTESRETLKLRNAICLELKAKGVKYIIDDDNDKLRDVLKKAQTGAGSVVLDIHFNAAGSTKATGIEVIVANDAAPTSVGFARTILNDVVTATGLPSRGVKTESDTARGKLGVMRESGIVALLEACFISNARDMKAYDKAMAKIAKKISTTLIHYDSLV